jgi:peptide/nickel transport system permease protein
VLTVLGITLIGESLNDLADPRLRARRRAAAASQTRRCRRGDQPTAQEFLGEVP